MAFCPPEKRKPFPSATSRGAPRKGAALAEGGGPAAPVLPLLEPPCTLGPAFHVHLCSLKALLPGACHESPMRACSHPRVSSREAPVLPLPSISCGRDLPASLRVGPRAPVCRVPGTPCSRATRGSCTHSLSYLSHTPFLGTWKALDRHNPCLKSPGRCSPECRGSGSHGGGLSPQSRARGAGELSRVRREGEEGSCKRLSGSQSATLGMDVPGEGERAKWHLGNSWQCRNRK